MASGSLGLAVRLSVGCEVMNHAVMGAGSQPEPFDLVGCACYNAYGRPTDTEDDAGRRARPASLVEGLARARASFEGKAELAALDQEQAEGEMTRGSFVAHVVWIESLLMRAMRKGAAR